MFISKEISLLIFILCNTAVGCAGHRCGQQLQPGLIINTANQFFSYPFVLIESGCSMMTMMTQVWLIEFVLHRYMRWLWGSWHLTGQVIAWDGPSCCTGRDPGLRWIVFRWMTALRLYIGAATSIPPMQNRTEVKIDQEKKVKSLKLSVLGARRNHGVPLGLLRPSNGQPQVFKDN